MTLKRLYHSSDTRRFSGDKRGTAKTQTKSEYRGWSVQVQHGLEQFTTWALLRYPVARHRTPDCLECLILWQHSLPIHVYGSAVFMCFTKTWALFWRNTKITPNHIFKNIRLSTQHFFFNLSLKKEALMSSPAYRVSILSYQLHWP